MRKDVLKPWETALLLALCLTFLVGLWADGRQRALADGLIRLHVVGASDAPEDQAEKLQARDRVLAWLAPLLADCRTREDVLYVFRGTPVARENPRTLLESTSAPDPSPWQATYSLATRFMPSLKGVTTMTSASR